MFKNEIDTHSYKGWLNSDFFFKRALAIVGYYIMGMLAVYVIVGIPVLVVLLLLVLINTL